MKHGHCTGQRRERRPRKDEAARLATMGQAIAAQWTGKTAAELLALAMQKPR